MIIWFIGLSGSGKTYLSNILYEKIKQKNNNTFLMDGDSFREAMGNDLGHHIDDRYKNGWRMARMSQMLDAQNINVIVPILSIFHEHQKHMQENTKKYQQIYIKSNIHTVSERDDKSIYKQRSNIVGRDIKFPEPINSNYIFENYSFCEKKAKKFIEYVFNEIEPILD